MVVYRFSLQDLTEENTCNAFSKGVGRFCWQNTFLYTGSQVKNTDILLCSQICFAWYLKCEIHNDLIVYFTNTILQLNKQDI